MVHIITEFAPRDFFPPLLSIPRQGKKEVTSVTPSTGSWAIIRCL